MGTNMIITLIMGITMSTILGTTIAPSIVEGVKVKKVQTQTINNQEVIFEAIKRYITIKQVAPTTMAQLTSAGYIDEKVNDNGFGEKYTFSVSTTTGVATITTTIVDPKAQEAFLNSLIGTSKPTRVGTTNNFETKFVLPNKVMHGDVLSMTGIPIGSTSPDSNTNKYWYDTSSGKAVLKLYDNGKSKWTEVASPAPAPAPAPEKQFIAGNSIMLKLPDNAVIGNKGYQNKWNVVYKIIPSKSGSFNLKGSHVCLVSSSSFSSSCKVEVRINNVKVDYFNLISSNTTNSNNSKTEQQAIFFKANDIIEILAYHEEPFSYMISHRLHDFMLLVTPESASTSDLKYTVFTYK